MKATILDVMVKGRAEQIPEGGEGVSHAKAIEAKGKAHELSQRSMCT